MSQKSWEMDVIKRIEGTSEIIPFTIDAVIIILTW